MNLLIALLIAAIAGIITKFVCNLFIPRYADVIALLVFLIVLLVQVS